MILVDAELEGIKLENDANKIKNCFAQFAQSVIKSLYVIHCLFVLAIRRKILKMITKGAY